MKQLIVRNIPPAIRDGIVWLRDLFRVFPDAAKIDGTEFRVVPGKFWITFNKGLWEPQIRHFFKRNVSPERCVIDIGAFIGPSVFAACVYHPKKIIAVEADPDNFEVLKKNCLQNRLNDLVELHNICIADQTGVTVPFGPMDSRLPHTAIHGIGGSGKMVETVSFQDFLAAQDLADVNIIKIDIEGGERFLTGGLRYLSGFPGISVFLALHPPFWPEKEKTAEALLDTFQSFELFTDMEEPLHRESLREMMLNDEKTVYSGKRGVFFDVILRTGL